MKGHVRIKQLKELPVHKSMPLGREGQVGPAQRYIVLSIFVWILILFALIVLNHAKLAILKYAEFKNLAADNTLTEQVIPASRGLILDFHHKKLAVNELSYDLYFSPRLITIDEVAKLFPTLKSRLQQRVKELGEIDRTYAYKRLLLHGIPKEIALSIKARKIKGLSVLETTKRNYPYKELVSHILGYTSNVTADDLKKKSDLSLDDIIGRTGLEAYYDKKLRGKKGVRLVETDKFGQIVSILSAATSYKPPINGDTLLLYINLDWQRSLYKHLAKAVEKYHARGGAGVILDVHTGGVIAMVSYPSFDNNLFIGGIDYKTYQRLVKDKRYPLLNRAIAAQEPAGSTFKTIVAAAALDTGAISESTRFNATGVIYLSGHFPFQDYHKHVYGWLTVRDALMVSSNIFFCKTMLKMGIDKFLPYAKNFGIGSPTGIDLPGEASGRLPSPENKIWLAKHGYWWLDPIWYPEGDACNSAIGQGITLVTPIQMANVAATIANLGTVFKPRLVKAFISPDGSQKPLPPEVKVKDFVRPKSLRVVQEGMRMSVSGPRAIIRVLNNLPVEVAAKTGTAEFGVKTKDGYLTTHAWVIGFWPYKNPKYSFVVLLEGGGPSYRAAEVMRYVLLDIYKK